MRQARQLLFEMAGYQPYIGFGVGYHGHSEGVIFSIELLQVLRYPELFVKRRVSDALG